MAHKAVINAQPARLLSAARRIALMLTIVVAVSACGAADGDRVGTAGGAAGEVPKVCQGARKASSDWLTANLATQEATGKVVTDSLFADELGQYPAVTTAQTKIAQAQTASLNKITAVRTAMIARDRRAEAAAGKQETATTTQLNVALKNWNNTVLPKYAAAVNACNKAIS